MCTRGVNYYHRTAYQLVVDDDVRSPLPPRCHTNSGGIAGCTSASNSASTAAASSGATVGGGVAARAEFVCIASGCSPEMTGRANFKLIISLSAVCAKCVSMWCVRHYFANDARSTVDL